PVKRFKRLAGTIYRTTVLRDNSWATRSRHEETVRRGRRVGVRWILRHFSAGAVRERNPDVQQGRRADLLRELHDLPSAGRYRADVAPDLQGRASVGAVDC